MTADFGSLVVMLGDGSDSFGVGDVGVPAKPPRFPAPGSNRPGGLPAGLHRTESGWYRPAAQAFPCRRPPSTAAPPVAQYNVRCSCASSNAAVTASASHPL